MLTTLKLPTKLHLIASGCQWDLRSKVSKKTTWSDNFSCSGNESIRAEMTPLGTPLPRACVNFKKHSGRATHGRTAATTAGSGSGSGSGSDQGGRKRITGAVQQPGDDSPQPGRVHHEFYLHFS